MNDFIQSLQNNATLVVEIGVGVIITLIVYRVTKISEKKNEEMLSRVDKITRFSQIEEYKKKRDILQEVQFSLKKIVEEITNILDSNRDFFNSDDALVISKEYSPGIRDDFWSAHKIEQQLEQCLENKDLINSDFFDPIDLNSFKTLRDDISLVFKKNSYEYVLNKDILDILKNSIEPFILDLDARVMSIQSDISKLDMD